MTERALAGQPRSGPGASAGAEDGWRSVAACRDADPELFFPLSAAGKSLQQIAAAKAICARCPVRAQCLAFAARTRQMHGVWGGLTERERFQVAASEPGTPAGAAQPDVLRESLERASCLPAGAAWEQGAAAHAEALRALADAATDPAAAQALTHAAEQTFELMITVGPAANGMAVMSRQRLLAHLLAGDAGGAALEVESHLRALHFMGRLAGRRC